MKIADPRCLFSSIVHDWSYNSFLEWSWLCEKLTYWPFVFRFALVRPYARWAKWKVYRILFLFVVQFPKKRAHFATTPLFTDKRKKMKKNSKPYILYEKWGLMHLLETTFLVNLWSEQRYSLELDQVNANLFKPEMIFIFFKSFA